MLLDLVWVYKEVEFNLCICEQRVITSKTDTIISSWNTVMVSITINYSDVPNFGYLVFSIRTLLQINSEQASTQHCYRSSNSDKLMHDLITKIEG